MRRLLLGPIEAFIVVARCRSLVEAAQIMNLTVPALSRRIQLLEADLGVRLFHRLPRGLALTEAGASYLAGLAPAWDQVRDATEAARVRSQSQVLTISVMPTFAANWLVPRLPRFPAAFNGIAVALRTEPDIIDLNDRPDIDGAIRLGKGPWPGVQAERLLAVDAFPVASTGFWAGRPPVADPRDLLGHPLIGSHHQADFWHEWFASAGIDAAEGQYRSFDNLQLVYEAAAAGMGIALGLDPLVRPFLQTGRLTSLAAAPVRLSHHFHLISRRGSTTSNRAFAKFRDWLFREVRHDARTAASP